MEPVVERGQVLCYRIWDIADEINLAAVESLLRQGVSRVRLTRENSQYLQLPNPPVTLGLGRHPLAVAGGTIHVEAAGRIFEHGAGSIILRVPLAPGTRITEMIPLVDELYDSVPLEALALELMQRLRTQIAAACERPHLWEQSESYTVTFIERFATPVSLQDLGGSESMARLLLGERDGSALSAAERASVTSHRFSYREDDLCVLDWNSAFVYEPSGSFDIPDLLEICNAQLLEFRYYDAMLDRLLVGIHEELAKERGPRLLRSPYKAMRRRVVETILEMSEFIERVENSLKIIGDFYLAKVYEAAVSRLRIPTWQASVTRKQQLLTQTYQVLKGEVDTARTLTLEAAVVLLIVTEIVLALVGHA